MSSVIVFEKNLSRDAIYFEHGEQLDTVQIFATHLKEYSRAALTRISVTSKRALTLTVTAGQYDTISVKAKLLMRDQNDGKLWGVIIPAPLSSMFEEVTGQGYRVKKTDGDILTGYYAAMSGLDLQFEEGWMVGGR
jgi:hypothetical protein